MIIRNSNKNTIVAENVFFADTPFKRAKGLLGRKELRSGECLIIKPCNSVHSFFMRFAIDVLFLDKNHRVVGMVVNLLPYRLSPLFLKAQCVIELPTGTIKATRTETNDCLLFE